MMRYYYCRIVVVFFFFIWIKDLFGRAEASPVEFLPGFDGPLPFHLETGYIGVDEGENVELFYYFVRSSSSSNGNDDPLILWLVGGPGCSGLSALLYEIGPLFIDKGEDEGLPKLSLNPYAWTKLTNIIFLDLPVGTGFSYAKTLNAAHSTGSQSCHQAYQFLRKWLIDHPEFASNPFYIGGSSYTGMTVPFIARLISDGNEAGVEPRINIKGYVLGNGATFPDEGNYKIPFAHGMGLISDELYESLMQTCEGNYVNVDSSNHPCLDNLDTFHQLVDDLSGEQILDPTCERIDSRSSRNGHRVLYNEERICTKKCYTYRHQYVPIWANNPSVQEALHIREGSIVGLWERCNRSLPYTNGTWDSTPIHAYLSTKGYRSLIYSGDHDMVMPFLSTQAWIRSLNYSIMDEWRQWLVRGQIAGYTRTYANNMTFATVKGGAHVAPESNPEECFAMFERWISYKPL
ncbi:serine carboxypeptidase-like 11 isoform X2 [Andrographis paniculata]|uniref:serine carboxypeptidase-like 11 isoform X2 n=1 Tax=Andrographis paniculata TaxID=175694 RepID=UPI0021E985BF|nr:serine carboxypeptidase-like 11 isoform X2 [Andrographis paniculata]